jgi:hypothetical protein
MSREQLDRIKKILGDKDWNLFHNPKSIKDYTDREVQVNEHDYLCDCCDTLLNYSIYSYYSDLYSIFTKEREKRNLEKLPQLFPNP